MFESIYSGIKIIISDMFLWSPTYSQALYFFLILQENAPPNLTAPFFPE